MKQPQQPPPNQFFQNFIAAYGRAWDNNDLQTILDYYHTPCFIFKGGRLYDNASAETKRRYFEDILADYRQQQAIRAEIPHFEVKTLGDNSALITVRWFGKRADGVVAFDYLDSYLLIRLDGQWKILGDTVYDPPVHGS